MEGSEEPEVPNHVLAASTLPTSQSKFSFHGVSRQFQLLVDLPYHLLLIHQQIQQPDLTFQERDFGVS